MLKCDIEREMCCLGNDVKRDQVAHYNTFWELNSDGMINLIKM